MAYQYLKEDDKAFHIKHPDGTTFQVAKRGLSKSTLTQIQAMPKMNEGGDVPDVLDPNYEAPQDPLALDVGDSAIKRAVESAPVKPTSEQGGLFNPENPHAAQERAAIGELFKPGGIGRATGSIPDPSLQPSSQMSSAPAAPTPGLGDLALGDQEQALAYLQAAPQAPQAPAGGGTGPMDSMKMYSNALDEEAAGVQGLADTQGELSQNQAKAYDEANTQFQKQEVERQAIVKQYTQEADQLTQAMKDQQVSPDHFMSSRSSAQKIFLGLGMALSAAAGNGETAVKMLDGAINRDIDAQKTQLGKTQNLLTLNMQKTRNINAAYDLTKAQILTSLEFKTRQMAASSGSQIVQNNAKIALSKIDMMRADLFNRASVGQQKAQAQFGGIPIAQEGWQLRNNPEYMKTRVAIGPKAYAAVSPEAASEQRIFEGKFDEAKSMIHELDSLGKKALIPGSSENQRAQSIQELLPNALAGLQSTTVGSKRINDAEIQTAKHAITDKTSFSQLLNGGLRNAEVLKFLDRAAQSSRAQNIPGYSPSSVQLTPGKK